MTEISEKQLQLGKHSENKIGQPWHHKKRKDKMKQYYKSLFWMTFVKPREMQTEYLGEACYG